MADSYPFDREFRLKILVLCLDNTWMAGHGPIIIPDYFEQKDESAFVKAVVEYRAKFGRSPIDPDDVITLTGGEYSIFIRDIYEKFDDCDTDLAKLLAVQYAQEQAAKLAILDSVDDIQTGNIQKAIERMKMALEVGKDLDSPGLDPIRDMGDWLYDYWESKVPTRLAHIDRALEGGVGAGEFAFVLGSQNRGKSMALINVAYGAASIGSGADVVYFTHEMSPKQVAKRIAARIVFRFPRPDDNLTEYSEALILAARRLLVGKIRIIGGRKSTMDVEAILDRLHAENFNFGIIIDDYLDLIKPPKHYEDRRYELSSIYEWFRELLERHKVPGWSASQATRNSYSKEIITLADVAEDIGKASIADIIVALCQTWDEDQVNQCRLFLAKVRDSRSRVMVGAKYYSDYQAIITTGFVKMKTRDGEDHA